VGGFESAVRESLRTLDEEGLRRRVRTLAASGARTVLAGRPVVSFASNDYLGLASDARLADALARGAREEGAGAGAARLLGGSRPAHDALEREVAAFKGTEGALLFGSGYAANATVIPALVGEGDLVVSDRLNHASVVDGCRLSRAEVAVVPHDDPAAIRAALGRGGFRRRLVAVEGLHSMEGTVAPLAAIREACDGHDALLLLDDAHGNGVLGPGGRGAAAEAGLRPGPGLLEIGTFGKAFGGFGAFAAWTAEGIELLRHRARGFVFSTALPPGVAAMDLEGMRAAAAGPERRARARRLADRLREALGGAARGAPGSPVVPVPVGDPTAAARLAEGLLERGIWAPAVRPPTVPEGTARLRVSVTADHREEEIDALAAALREALRG
jgi:8-amino-7-oxononanoate synthase